MALGKYLSTAAKGGSFGDTAVPRGKLPNWAVLIFTEGTVIDVLPALRELFQLRPD